MATLGELLHVPSAAAVERAGVTQLMRWLREERGVALDDYFDLWRWSVADVDRFWREQWSYHGLGEPLAPGQALADASMPGAVWFPGQRVNYARRMLDAGPDDAVAIHAFSELRDPVVMTRAELRTRVYRLARALRSLGVRPGDRVAAYLPNTPEAVIGLLAVTGIGAVWSSCSPDFGVGSALDRFRQIEPRVLLSVDGYRYGGRDFDRRAEVREMVDALPGLSRVIHLAYLFPDGDGAPDGALAMDAVLEGGEFDGDDDPLEASLPFDHPLWIVYSSGTTGLPKGMVHGHGGCLLEHLKLTTAHLGLRPGSRLFFYTTTGWIMFNLLSSALICGATAVQYDGNPGWPDENTLFRIAEESGTTNFGTSPTFVQMLGSRGARPMERFDLTPLEGVLCTGSPLTPESFNWIYEHVKRDLWVSSISGGTDVASGFVGGVQTLPVHSGELQAPLLGIDVAAFDDRGQPVVGEEGELVVTQPMPSMPLRFWNDDDGSRYRDAYFDHYPGAWRHGDLLKVTERGSYVISGRSDSTLNRHGIRIGTSEIYRTVEADEDVLDSIVLHLDSGGAHDRLVLFVVLRDGAVLDDALKRRLVVALREERSPRHVPEVIASVPAIPYTLTGKKMEVPLKRILQGADPERVANADAMMNPDALAAFVAMTPADIGGA